MKKTVFLCLLFLAAATAKASITIYPKYIFLDEKNKSAKLFLINQDEVNSYNYRLGLRSQKQTHTGAVEKLSAPSVLQSKLKFSPKYVRELGPQKQQVIKIAMADFASIPDGDHSIYLTIANTEPTQELTAVDPNRSDITINLKVIPEVALPVIVRKGTVNTKGVLENISVKENIVHFTLKRAHGTGAPGVIRGDISVWHGGTMLGIVKGRYLLPENDFTSMTISLEEAKAKTPKAFKEGAQFKLMFTAYTDAPGADTKNIICENTFSL